VRSCPLSLSCARRLVFPLRGDLFGERSGVLDSISCSWPPTTTERFLLCFLGAQSSDIRKWFMKTQDKSATAPSGAAAKPSGAAAAAEKKKPVLSIPENMAAPPALVGCFPPFLLVLPSCLLMVTNYGCFRRGFGLLKCK
jgi:hypothetical protein